MTKRVARCTWASKGARNPPDLATVLIHDEAINDITWSHHLLAEDLLSLADFSLFPGSVRSLIDDPTKALQSEIEQDRSIFAWSQYEADVLRPLLTEDDRWIADEIENARKVAERWLRRTDPGHQIFGRPRGKRHRLIYYLDLIGYDPVDPEFQPATGINEMRRELREVEGYLMAVSEKVMDMWRMTLARNYRDCEGMREVMLRVAEDNPFEIGN